MTVDKQWPEAVENKLRDHYASGFSYAVIATLLNEEFKTEHSDQSVRSKLRRIGVNNGDSHEAYERSTIWGERSRYEQYDIDKVKEGSRIVLVGDIQAPFHDPKVLSAVEHFMEDFEPDYMVEIGDIFDMYLMSDFSKSPSRGNKLQDELDIGSAIMERHKRITRGAKEHIFIEGNHEDRLRRWLQRNAPQVASLRSMNPQELLGLEDWHYLTYGSRVNFLGTLFEHGDIVRSGSAATARAMMLNRGSSGVSGHTHRFSTVTNRDAHREYIWIENGCLCKLELEYRPRPDWAHAFTYGIVRNGELRLFPVQIKDYEFRAEGRWYRASARDSR